MKHFQHTTLAIVLGAAIAVILWITLFSRLGNYNREFLEPFWSYRAILQGDLDVAYEDLANVLLFVPLGFAIQGLFNLKVWAVAIIGVLASLAIESSQWILYLGSFEVDDIVNNSFGCVLGWYLARKMLAKHVIQSGYRILIIALLSTLCFALMPYGYCQHRAEKMRAYAAMNNRADGAVNLLVLNGEEGYVGKTKVYVTYNKDASIAISGTSDKVSYKLLGTPFLEAGEYVFTGFSDIKRNVFGLYLEKYSEKHNKYVRFTADLGPNDRITFKLTKNELVRVYLKTYIGGQGMFLARPVIYKEK